jgi:hypothetical protein
MASPPKRKPVAELPAFIPTQLATLVDRAPAGGEWLHEIKYDGYRTAARLGDRSASMLTRNALDWTARFGPIAVAATKLKVSTAYIDGEIAVLDDAGISDFGALQEALSEGRTERMIYFVFDLLHLDGRDLRGLPLMERKAHLEKRIGRVGDGGPIRYSDHIIGRGPDFYKQACKSNLEGIVSKRAGAPYPTLPLVPLHRDYDSLIGARSARAILVRARSMVNIQVMRAPSALLRFSQAAISEGRRSRWPMRRSRPWPRSTPISTMLSQLACLGT